jgi:hypothetical protein
MQKLRIFSTHFLMSVMFSGIYPEDPSAMKIFKNRIEQGAAAGISEVLTFGHTKGANRKL